MHPDAAQALLEVRAHAYGDRREGRPGCRSEEQDQDWVGAGFDRCHQAQKCCREGNAAGEQSEPQAAAAPPLEKEPVATCTSSRIASPVMPIGSLPTMDAAIVCFISRGSSSAT